MRGYCGKCQQRDVPCGRMAFKQGSLPATSAAQDMDAGPFFPHPRPALTLTLTPSLNSHLWKLDSPPFSFGLWDPVLDLSRVGPWAPRVNCRTVSPITSRWRHPPRTLVPTQDIWSQRSGSSWPRPIRLLPELQVLVLAQVPGLHPLRTGAQSSGKGEGGEEAEGSRVF